jgi:hypothetical protein
VVTAWSRRASSAEPKNPKGSPSRPNIGRPSGYQRATIPPGKGIEHHSSRGCVWRAAEYDMTVPRVCPNCNHHWLSDIESRTRNIALPLIRGDDKRSLTAAEQRQLSIWCFMKAITLELGRPSGERPTHPEELYSGFKRFRQPPVTSCAVLIGRREIEADDPSPMTIWFNSQGRNHPVPGVGDVSGYRTAFLIGHLVVDVLGVHAGNAQAVVENDDHRLVRIWPVAAPTVTLPAEGFVGIENNELI